MPSACSWQVRTQSGVTTPAAASLRVSRMTAFFAPDRSRAETNVAAKANARHMQTETRFADMVYPPL